MKTLILNGSPRPHGDTASLIAHLTQHLSGDIKIVDAYRSRISPCVDCRRCWKENGCAIADEMQEVYAYIPECDNVVIASPVYFSELTGKLLDVASRLQMFYCAKRFRNERLIEKEKRGAIILAGGGEGGPQKAMETARMLLRLMNCHEIFEPVFSGDTDRRPACEDEKALKGVLSIAEFLKRNR